MSQKTIYIVEDEQNIQELLKVNLEENGYRVKLFQTGEALLEECKYSIPDLFMLDIMLPGIDGLEVCARLRQDVTLRKVPIMMLTAKSDEIDKVLGLEMGAEDYISKPFGIRELLARVRVIFRRQLLEKQEVFDILEFGDVKVNFLTREVFKSGNIVDLTYKEFELLQFIIKNKKQVLTREKILQAVWDTDYYGGTRTVDVHIRYLRQKLENDDKNPQFIETVRGLGYRFNIKGDVKKK